MKKYIIRRKASFGLKITLQFSHDLSNYGMSIANICTKRIGLF